MMNNMRPLRFDTLKKMWFDIEAEAVVEVIPIQEVVVGVEAGVDQDQEAEIVIDTTAPILEIIIIAVGEGGVIVQEREVGVMKHGEDQDPEVIPVIGA